MAKDWECNTCGNTEGVINGICPDCGPTQTTPLSETAKQEGGYYIAEAEKAARAEAEARANQPADNNMSAVPSDSTSTVE